MWSSKEIGGNALHWNSHTNMFWFGANGNEYMAWKGSHQILIYPCDKYPNPPSGVIQHNKRIETLKDFEDALNTGHEFDCVYVKSGILE